MQLKRKLGLVFGFLTTLSSILALPFNLERVISWLSTMVGISMSLDIAQLILYVGIALFPTYLLVNVIFWIKKRRAKKVFFFEAEILDKKRFEVGETVFTKVHFKGQLKNGFFDNYIVSPSPLPDGRDHTWSWDKKTLPDGYPNTPGNLHGNVDFESTWDWIIPPNYPIGEYRIFIRVYDHLGVENRPVIREKKETITITKRPDLISTKPQVIKSEYDFSSFDVSFKALQYATEPKTKEIMMREFQPKLRDLCYDAVWNDETRMRVIKVLDYIPEKLSEDPNVDYYLHFIGLIIHKDIEQIKNSVKEKFLEELEKLYDDPRYETNKQILNLLQKLHEYSEDYMLRLIDEASSISKWSDQRFQVQALDIQLWELGSRNQNAYDRVLKHLRRKMNDAERNNDEKIYGRLKKLYELVKR